MSEDLGRFVAIRDRDLDEVLQENKRLRAELARINETRIRVTGPGGLPVYAEVDIDSLDSDEKLVLDAENDTYREVPSHDVDYYRMWARTKLGERLSKWPCWDTEVCKCPNTDIERAELRVGNDFVFELADCEKETSEHEDRCGPYTENNCSWKVDGKEFRVVWIQRRYSSDGTMWKHVEFTDICVPRDWWMLPTAMKLRFGIV